MINDSWLWLWWLVMIERWMIHRWYDMMAHNQNLKNPVQGPPPKSGCPGRWYGHPAEWQLRSWRRIPLHRPVSGALLPWRGLHWCELRSPSTSPSAQVRTTAQCVGLSAWRLIPRSWRMYFLSSRSDLKVFFVLWWSWIHWRIGIKALTCHKLQTPNSLSAPPPT